MQVKLACHERSFSHDINNPLSSVGDMNIFTALFSLIHFLCCVALENDTYPFCGMEMLRFRMAL